MTRRAAAAALAAAAVLVVARLWAMPLPSSLWLDEFGTVWVTDGGLSQVLERARLFPQSIPYAALVAIVRGAFGSSEAVLRLPSLLAMLAAAVLVVRLGRACFDAETGGLGGGIFLLFPTVEFAAGDARPYAFAVLAATAALLFLKSWLDAGRARDGVAYVLAASAAVYFHYLFAAALAGHAVYAVLRRRRGTPVTGVAMAAAAAALAVLLAPAARLAAAIGADRRSHEFGTVPGLVPLVNALLPVRVVALLLPMVIGVFALRVARGVRRTRATSNERDSTLLLLSAAAAPPAILFGVSRALGTSLFEGRYLLSTAPAWAVLLGALLSRVEPAAAARFALAGALLLGVVLRGDLGRGRIDHGREDWREALAEAERAAPGAPVLLSGSFAEARDPALAGDPRHQGYLTAPVRYYRPRTAAIALPLGSAPGSEPLAQRLAGPALLGRRFLLVERRSRLGSRTEWLDGLASPRGFSGREVWRSGPLRVRLYERPGAAD